MFQTEVVDVFIDNHKHQKRNHESEALALAYATDVSTRSRSEVNLYFGQTPIDTYIEGKSQLGAARIIDVSAL